MGDLEGKANNEIPPPSPGGAAVVPGASEGKKRQHDSDLEIEQPISKKSKEDEENAAETSGTREEEETVTAAALEAKQAERDLLRQGRDQAFAGLLLLSTMEYALLPEILFPAADNNNDNNN